MSNYDDLPMNTWGWCTNPDCIEYHVATHIYDFDPAEMTCGGCTHSTIEATDPPPEGDGG